MPYEKKRKTILNVHRHNGDGPVGNPAGKL